MILKKDYRNYRTTIENVRTSKNIKPVTTERWGNYLVSEPNYPPIKFYTKSISNRNEKTEIIINEPVCLGLWIPELSKTLMYEFSYDYVELKYGEKSKFCYMDTDSFILYKKTDIMIFIKMLQKMLKQDLILQIIN